MHESATRAAAPEDGREQQEVLGPPDAQQRPGFIPSWEIDGETVETVSDFILGGSKITADGDCSHEIKRCLLFGRYAMQETWIQSLGWEDPLEKGTATHSSILAWRIPWTEEPGTLQSMGPQRVGHS